MLKTVPSRHDQELKAQEQAASSSRDPALGPAADRRLPSQTRKELVYQKSADVLVDIRWLGGRSFTSNRVEIESQLGPFRSRQDLGDGRGEELVFERGILRVVRDRVYMVRVAFDKPVTRGEALELTGFPPYVDPWRETHHEYRLGHEWGFRRFRLRRESQANDRVVSIEAWKSNPEDVTR